MTWLNLPRKATPTPRRDAVLGRRRMVYRNEPVPKSSRLPFSKSPVKPIPTTSPRLRMPGRVPIFRCTPWPCTNDPRWPRARRARRYRPDGSVEELQTKGLPVAFVGDVVGTGSSRKSATNSVLWFFGDDIDGVPNKRGGGICIGGKVAPIFLQHHGRRRRTGIRSAG